MRLNAPSVVWAKDPLREGSRHPPLLELWITDSRSRGSLRRNGSSRGSRSISLTSATPSHPVCLTMVATTSVLAYPSLFSRRVLCDFAQPRILTIFWGSASICLGHGEDRQIARELPHSTRRMRLLNRHDRGS